MICRWTKAGTWWKCVLLDSEKIGLAYSSILNKTVCCSDDIIDLPQQAALPALVAGPLNFQRGISQLLHADSAAMLSTTIASSISPSECLFLQRPFEEVSLSTSMPT